MLLENFNQMVVDPGYDAAIFNFATEGNLLYFTMVYVYHKYDWSDTIPAIDGERFRNLVYGLQNSYKQNFYHNQVHAADVVQSMLCYLESCEFKQLCQMTPCDIFFSLMSAAAHDMDHPGLSNVFMVKSGSRLATLYNDQAVLENHHAASFFFLLDREDNNCLVKMTESEKLAGRKIIVESILATDMTKHGMLLQEIKAISQ